MNSNILFLSIFHLFLPDSEIVTIGEKTGKINVNAIDRDARKNEFYPFDVIAGSLNCNQY